MQLRSSARRAPVDRFELGVLAAFAVLASGPLLYLLWQVAVHGRDWIGIDYGSPQDQLQYVSWIRESADHVLVGDPYDPASAERALLHPGIALSGFLARLGFAPWLALLVWKPVAVAGLFLATRAYVRRGLDDPLARRAALVLALFYVVATAPLAGHLLSGEAALELGASAFELWPGTWLWGYSFAALGVAALAAALLAYERDVEENRIRPWAPLLGLLCAWLQPWQGATLALIVLAAEVTLLLRGSRMPGAVRRSGLTLAATGAPLAYYALLGATTTAWKVAGEANQIFNPAWWAVALVIAPLAVPATLAYRGRADSFGDLALRIWPVAGLGLLLFIALTGVGTYAPHSLQGLSIPLAVLAVRGTRAWRPRLVGPGLAALAAFAALALVTLPVTVEKLREAHSKIARNDGPFFIEPGEREAFEELDRTAAAGPVLARYELGQMVPALTGRKPFVGSTSWTPDFFRRDFYVDSLYAGRLTPRQARSLARASGARFVLSGCSDGAPLGQLLGPLVASSRRFGCATVYTLREVGRKLESG